MQSLRLGDEPEEEIEEEDPFSTKLMTFDVSIYIVNGFFSQLILYLLFGHIPN